MEQDEITQTQKQIESRLADLIQQAPEETALSLVKTVLSIFAEVYPPTLSEKEIQQIRDNYPSATNKLIRERAMAEEGVIMAVATASEMARIAIDYSPLSHMKPDMDHDMALGEKTKEAVAGRLEQNYKDVLAQGLTPFGASSATILHAVVQGKKHGASGFALVRSLLDALTLAVDGDPMESEEEFESAALNAVSEQLGLSRETAQKYLAMISSDGQAS